MSTERWASLKDRTVIMHEENDGWTFLTHGAEECEEETTLAKLAAEHPNRLVSLIMEELRAHYRTEHKVENWQSLSYTARNKALSEVEDGEAGSSRHGNGSRRSDESCFPHQISGAKSASLPAMNAVNSPA